MPLTVAVPLTARVGVEEPESTTLFTDVGVIAPSVNVIAGVVVAVATLPETPPDVVTLTEVTVPDAAGVKYSNAVAKAFTRNCCEAVPSAVNPVPPCAIVTAALVVNIVVLASGSV